jgi:hypothetical protein
MSSTCAPKTLLRAAAAGAATLALLAGPVVSRPVAHADPVPVAPDLRTVELPDDRAATTRIDVPDGVTVMGVTWQPDEPGQEPGVQVRARRDGAWGPWVTVAGSDDGPDPGTVEERRADAAGAPAATDPVDVAGADVVEVRTSRVEQVSDVAAALVDPGESRADAAVTAGGPAASADAAVAKPAIVTRAQWGADEKLRSCTPSTAASLKGVILHHTADRNTYTADEGPAMVRSIYAYHTKVNKWCDVGYNALVDRFGRIYEGRFGGLEKNVIGAHAGGFNTGTWGVSVIGNFEAAALPAAAQASVEKLVGWRLGVAKLDPAKTMTLTSGGSNKFAAGKVVTLPLVAAHRDVGLTACPGQKYYDRLGTVRTNIKKLMAPPPPKPAPAPAPAPARKPVRISDFTSDGRADVLARAKDGRLLMYAGNGRGSWATGRAQQVGTGWNVMTMVVTPGDVTGDGRSDLYARDKSGRLWLYPGNGKGGFGKRKQVGSGWHIMNAIVGTGDYDGDGRGDVIARDTAGRLWLYPNAGGGAFKARRQIGTGWNSFTALIGVGDFNGDGRADLLARHRDGRLLMYAGNGKGGWSRTAVRVGTGWSGFTAVFSVGDFTGDGRADVMARDKSGRLWLYPGNGKGGLQARKQIGTGWGPFTALA